MDSLLDSLIYIYSKHDNKGPKDPQFRLPTIDVTNNHFTIEESHNWRISQTNAGSVHLNRTRLRGACNT